MLKITIDNEEVLSNKNFTIEEEMLNTPSVVLDNVYPKSWENDKDYVSRFYHPNDYSKCLIKDEIYTPAEPGLNVEGTNFQITADTTKRYEITSMKGQTTQNGTPTPDTPVEIQNVTGLQNINVCGKNLFGRLTKGYIGNNGEIISGNTNDKITPYIPTQANKTYWLTGLSGSYSRGAVYDQNKNFISEVLANVAGNTRSFTTPNNACYLLVSVSDYSDTKQIQLEQNNQATTYEPYIGKSYPIYLGVENLWKNQLTGFLPQSGSYPTTSSSYPNARYVLINLLAGQSITLSGSTSNFGRVRYIDKDTNQVVGMVNSGETAYYKSTSPFVAGFTEGTITAKKDFIVGIMDMSGAVNNLVVNYGTTPQYISDTPIELCKIGNYQDRIFKSSGKNLFDNTYNNLGMWNTNIGATTDFAQGSQYLGAYCKVEPGTYTISRNKKTNRFRIGVSPVQPTGTSSTCYVVASNDNASSITIDVPQGNNYICIYLSNNSETSTNVDLMINKGSTALPYEPYGTSWYLKKEIGKVVLNGSESGWNTAKRVDNTTIFFTKIYNELLTNNASVSNELSNYFKVGNPYTSYENTIWLYKSGNNNILRIGFSTQDITTKAQFTTWLSTHNTSLYYILATPTYTEITDSELINQLESIELLEGLNNVSVVSPYLQGIINLHYNFVNEETTSNLLFCGVVKNSGNISLNPRYPHYQSLQILDFKTFLSEGETLDFVIANKTIEEAIDQIISTIAPYGFVKGNIQIIGADNVIGAYSTKDKTAYDVFNYLADITQSRWTTRLIDENTVAVDFYDPTLLPQGTPINYNETWFRNNLIDDMSYSYGSNDYRNKQVMTSNEVYGSILQTQTMVANGYQTQFDTELKIGQITSITANGTQLTIATNEQKELGFNADIYYTPGNNYFESADLRSTGEILIVNYIAIVEGRQIITNGTEINRVATATGRKGIVARYENRNDANTSNELQLIGQSYIRYKGTPEIKLTIVSRKNLWNIGDRVQFNAPIDELKTEYMVKKKTINRILANPSSEEHIVYTYEMTSSFNSEQAINYFDNQRAKAKGNIGQGEYITRNVDIENVANIIFYGSNVEQATITGDNTLQATLSSPIIN